MTGKYQDSRDEQTPTGKHGKYRSERQKLTVKDVEAIRREYAKTGASYMSLGAKFNVSSTTISKIVRCLPPYDKV